MKMFVAVVVALCVPLAIAGEARLAVTPIEKVLEMLTGMLERGKADKHQEAVDYAGFKQFCDDTVPLKQTAIKEGMQTIDILTADIEKGKAEASNFEKEIARHEADVLTWQGDSKAAVAARAVEKEDYMKVYEDYSESITAIKAATAHLKKNMKDTPGQAAAFVQVVKDLPRVPQAAKKALDSFLQEVPEQDALSVLAMRAPEANAYEWQSSGIIEMLEKLLDKFTEERAGLQKEEVEKRHANDHLLMDLKNSVSSAESQIEFKKEAKSAVMEDLAHNKGELVDATQTKEADEKYLSDLVADCQSKADEFEKRQDLRAQEIEVITKAIEAISGSKAKKVLYSAIQKATSLAQIRGSGRSSSPNRDHVIQYLTEQAKVIDSRVLSTLAMKIESQDDPFKKVTKMIEDLISKLLAQAAEEATHKGWCDEELSTNHQTRKEKTAAVEKLYAEIDELQASIAKLKQDIAALSKQVAELMKAMAKAQEIRVAEKEKNEATIEDAKAGQEAIAQAIGILKDFYAGDADASLLQRKKAGQPEKPEIFTDKPLEANTASSTGVIGFLEVIQSDFARLESETTSEEEANASDHEAFMEDTKKDKEKKEKDISDKSAEKQNQEQTLQEKQEDLETTQQQLSTANAYFDKLKPDCLSSGQSYNERVERRKEEIEALKEALKILSGETVFLQR